MFTIPIVLSGLALAFGSYAALKEPTLAARSCFVTSLVVFILAVLGGLGR
ncbi:MAG TPA: hypothetical protein VM531_11115 [Sphingomicrobium sp.]|nr:hypothetical protein [Sphingomicrobium sp.]